ncbi:MAG: hypothetical protein M3R38_33575 [Actinomycetota bacterium]|nr:hypothetical protein [Actinomycetota bacterium]
MPAGSEARSIAPGGGIARETPPTDETEGDATKLGEVAAVDEGSLGPAWGTPCGLFCPASAWRPSSLGAGVTEIAIDALPER